MLWRLFSGHGVEPYLLRAYATLPLVLTRSSVAAEKERISCTCLSRLVNWSCNALNNEVVIILLCVINFLVLTVKKWLKSVYIYGSCDRKIKTRVSLFGPLCRWETELHVIFRDQPSVTLVKSSSKLLACRQRLPTATARFPRFSSPDRHLRRRHVELTVAQYVNNRLVYQGMWLLTTTIRSTPQFACTDV